MKSKFNTLLESIKKQLLINEEDYTMHDAEFEFEIVDSNKKTWDLVVSADIYFEDLAYDSGERGYGESPDIGGGFSDGKITKIRNLNISARDVTHIETYINDEGHEDYDKTHFDLIELHPGIVGSDELYKEIRRKAIDKLEDLAFDRLDPNDVYSY